MDHGRRPKSRTTSEQRYRGQDDRSLMLPTATATLTAHLSAPIPQTQWNAVPDVFRPPSWGFNSSRDKPLPEPPVTRPSSTPAGESSTKRRLQRKQRPEGLQRRGQSSSLYPNTNTLYPQMSPYNTHGMVRSAPHDVQHFPPADLGIYMGPSTVDTFRTASLPRSPTYPGTSPRGRYRSVSTGNDNALQDEADFRLFIEATTGLGPIPTFRQNSIVEDNWLDTRGRPRDYQSTSSTQGMIVSPISEYTGTLHSDRGRTNHIVSPMGETPTTIQALRSLAQLPHARSTSSERRRREDLAEPLVDISDSGLNIWDDTTEPANAPHPADSWMDANDSLPDDDLPDYAMSQAQAHASQRAEATRRAQELQRRWREGGRKYGAEI